jgi:hypothetical protein
MAGESALMVSLQQALSSLVGEEGSAALYFL